ncbi:MAG: glycine cleavage system protein GcvH [Thermoguttaceae bacterium]
MNAPENLYYTKEHEWVRVEGSKGYIGITDFAQTSLGDIVFVELPELDQEIEAHGQIGTIESVKAVSPLYSPVSGKVIEINEELETKPELLNTAPYDTPICTVSLSAPEEIAKLMSAADYLDFCLIK